MKNELTKLEYFAIELLKVRFGELKNEGAVTSTSRLIRELDKRK